MVGKSKSYCLNVGVASKSELIKNKFNWTLHNEGLYLINNEGYPINSANILNQKHVKFSFHRGSVLELEYLEES